MTIVTVPDATSAPLPLSVNDSGAVTGLTVTVRLRDGSTTNSYLDFNDNTFKAAGWTTQNKALTEVGGGHYHTTFNPSLILALTTQTILIAEFIVTGSVDAVIGERVMFREECEAVTTDTVWPLLLSVNDISGGVTGDSPTVRVRDGSTTNSYLDWADNAFKTSGWTTQDQLMTEVGDGFYHQTLSLVSIGATEDDDYIIEYASPAGVTGIASENLELANGGDGDGDGDGDGEPTILPIPDLGPSWSYGPAFDVADSCPDTSTWTLTRGAQIYGSASGSVFAPNSPGEYTFALTFTELITVASFLNGLDVTAATITAVDATWVVSGTVEYDGINPLILIANTCEFLLLIPTPMRTLHDIEAGLLAAPGRHASKVTATQMLWKQFSTATTWNALACMVGEIFAEVEVYYATVNAARVLETGGTHALDQIGVFFGLPREGLNDDEEYRAALFAQGVKLTASGTEPEVASILAALALTGLVVTAEEQYPAAIILTALGGMTLQEQNLVALIMDDALALGVGSVLVNVEEGSMGGFDSNPTDSTIANYGSFDTTGIEGLIATTFSLFTSSTGL